MNKLNILTFPDPRLRKTAEPVKDFNDEFKIHSI
jgi:N-formylmethionyl-tRNA deformylase